MTKTIRLTMAQALTRFMTRQMTVIEGEKVPIFGGVWAIFGHGNVAGIAFQPELAWQELMPWLKARRVAPEPDFYVPPPETGPVPPIQSAEGSVQLNLPARVRETSGST